MVTEYNDVQWTKEEKQIFFPYTQARQRAADVLKKNTAFIFVWMMLKAYKMATFLDGNKMTTTRWEQ